MNPSKTSVLKIFSFISPVYSVGGTSHVNLPGREKEISIIFRKGIMFQWKVTAMTRNKIVELWSGSNCRLYSMLFTLEFPQWLFTSTEGPKINTLDPLVL